MVDKHSHYSKNRFNQYLLECKVESYQSDIVPQKIISYDHKQSPLKTITEKVNVNNVSHDRTIIFLPDHLQILETRELATSSFWHPHLTYWRTSCINLERPRVVHHSARLVPLLLPPSGIFSMDLRNQSTCLAQLLAPSSDILEDLLYQFSEAQGGPPLCQTCASPPPPFRHIFSGSQEQEHLPIPASGTLI